MSIPWSRTTRDELAMRLKLAFKPGTPVSALELFAERKAESRALLAAIQQNGQHAILFGERGVGKTSLANVLSFMLHCPGWPKLAPIVNCARQDKYGELWGRVFLEIRDLAKKQELSLPRSIRKPIQLAEEGFADPITMDTVRRVLTDIGETAALVVVIDEFDTLQDKNVRSAIADTIKYLSDRNAPFTIILLGVSDDVETLIEDHHSIERCLAQVRMPRMSRDELEAIVRKCLSIVRHNQAPITIENDAVYEISRIATGLPHYAHLLGLHSGTHAVENSTLKVTVDHVNSAVDDAISNSHLSVQNAFLRATESSQKTAQYGEVLVACSMAETNDLGYFSPSDVRGPLSRILKKTANMANFTRHLHAFCEVESGPVLRSTTIRNRPQFRFVNPLMQPFALLKGLSQKIICEDDLIATRDPNDPQQRLF